MLKDIIETKAIIFEEIDHVSHHFRSNLQDRHKDKIYSALSSCIQGLSTLSKNYKDRLITKLIQALDSKSPSAATCKATFNGTFDEFIAEVQMAVLQIKEDAYAVYQSTSSRGIDFPRDFNETIDAYAKESIKKQAFANTIWHYRTLALDDQRAICECFNKALDDTPSPTTLNKLSLFNSRTSPTAFKAHFNRALDQHFHAASSAAFSQKKRPANENITLTGLSIPSPSQSPFSPRRPMDSDDTLPRFTTTPFGFR